MEFLGGIRFQDMKLQSMHHLLDNSRPLTKGLTVIVVIDHRTDISALLTENDSVRYICVTSELRLYKEVIQLFEGTKHVLLYSQVPLYQQYNQAMMAVATTHVAFMKVGEHINYHHQSLDEQTIVLPQRFSNGRPDAYFNSVFMPKEEVIEVAQAQDEPHREEQDFQLQHPFAIQVTVPELPVEKADVLPYPVPLYLERLYVFTGLIFPLRQLQHLSFQAVETEHRFMTQLLTSTDLHLHYDATIRFDAAESALSKLNAADAEPLARIDYYARLMSERHNPLVIDFLQYKADSELLKLSNAMDKGELDRIKIFSQLQYDKLNLSVLNKGQAEELVIAYCFPPYNDTSGNVMAKRIFVENNRVDVIYNKMDRIRSKDESLMQISNHLIDTMFEMSAPQAFSSWGSIEAFMEQGMDVYRRYDNKYKRLYSRAMFPASHFLAHEIKQMAPDIHWRAEFSDPLHTDIKSDIRYAPIDDKDYVARVTALMPQEYQQLADDNVFNLCELLPLAFAEELIFTNEHQLEYMIERFSPSIQASIRERAQMIPHPTLPQPFYELQKSYYAVDESKINLAYFGNFYDTRGFRELELVAKYLEQDGINNIEIHIFTNLNAKVMQFYNNSAFKSYMIMNPYVDFFEFLNLTNKMDGLIIFDAHTKGIKKMNPYLPSKLSDYLGSDAHTLAFTESGSILSKQTHEKLIKVDMVKYSRYSQALRQLADKIGKEVHRNATFEAATEEEHGF